MSGCACSPTRRTIATRCFLRRLDASAIRSGRTQTSKDFQAGVPRQGPLDRQRRTPAVPEMGSVTPTEAITWLLPFEEVWLHDFEFVSKPGERPDVVCLAARELRSGQTLLSMA